MPDPCSRFQPHGVGGLTGGRSPHSHCRVSACRSTSWSSTSSTSGRSPRRGRSTRRALSGRAPRLGVTAIELMPVATFPGDRGWGYDASHVLAAPCLRRPGGLARLVDAAHREGLGVILDVVYNHLGPGRRRYRVRAVPHRRHGPSGARVDFAQRGVREWAIQNAALGRGLRDRRPAARRRPRVRDPLARHVLEELADRLHVAVPAAPWSSPRPFRRREAGRSTDWEHDARWAAGSTTRCTPL